MKDEQLKEYKKLYLETSPTTTSEEGWKNLSQLLPKQKANIPTFRYAFIFACILFLILFGTVTVSQAAKPGNILYPVKVLSDKVVSKISQTVESKKFLPQLKKDNPSNDSKDEEKATPSAKVSETEKDQEDKDLKENNNQKSPERINNNELESDHAVNKSSENKKQYIKGEKTEETEKNNNRNAKNNQKNDNSKEKADLKD